MVSALLLSRLQFAFTISFHILFPAFSIGLAIFLATMEGLWIKTKDPEYLNICKFWTQIFALTFGMGVVSGVVMEFQLGTNWANFTRLAGVVLGPLFTYEVMTAFFIEAGFLGVMLFGWERVGPKLHYLSTLLVTLGTTLSAYWIMAANSWMQHPVGYQKINNMFSAINRSEIIFNSVTTPRFIHMILASYICAGFVISSVCAFYLLNNRHTLFSKKCFSFIWGILFILIPLQIFFGDKTGIAVHETQPIKTAAIEGIWETERGSPFLLLAIPNKEKQLNTWSLGIPYGSALINTHDWNGELVGLKSVPPENQPNVAIVFYSFRIMVFIGLVMLLLSSFSFYLKRKKRLFDSRLFLKICWFSAPLGFIALWCGWITAEVGRQPWIIYNVLKTTEAISNVSLHNVIISFALIFIVYGIIFGYFYFYFLDKIIRKGPSAIQKAEITHQPFQYMPPPTLSEKNHEPLSCHLG